MNQSNPLLCFLFTSAVVIYLSSDRSNADSAEEIQNGVTSTQTQPAGDIINDFYFLPDLPNSIGVAGPCVGTHNHALIVAGGANFPDIPLVEGGTKVWQDQIFVLEPDRDNWETRFRLNRKLAYGGAASARRGMVIASLERSPTHTG